MELTESQLRAVKLGQPVRLVADEVGAECILVLADVFDRLKGYLYDDSPLTPDEKTRLLVEAGLRAGWDDPELDVYNDLGDE